MFAVIYRSWVWPDQEDRYQALWQTIANYFVTERGAIGSCLHKITEGYYLAYSRWPDRATRDASWSGDGEPSSEIPAYIAQAIGDIRLCIDPDRRMPEITMDVACDYL